MEMAASGMSIVFWGVIGVGVATISTFALLKCRHNYKEQFEMLRVENDLLHLEINTALSGWIKVEGREEALQEQLDKTNAMLEGALAEKEEQMVLLEGRLKTRIGELEHQNVVLESGLRTSREKLKEVFEALGLNAASSLKCG